MEHFSRVGEECEQWVADLIDLCLDICPNCRPRSVDVLAALHQVRAHPCSVPQSIKLTGTRMESSRA